jgi:hypothetical protein
MDTSRWFGMVEKTKLSKQCSIYFHNMNKQGIKIFLHHVETCPLKFKEKPPLLGPLT